MAITNPEVIRYTNEVIRPLAEKMRNLGAEVDAALVTWYFTMSTKVPNDARLLDDGRDTEGVSRLTGADITNLVTQLAAYQALLNKAGVADVISKPTVRTLTVG